VFVYDARVTAHKNKKSAKPARRSAPALDQYLRRRRWRRIAIAAGAVLLVLALALADHRGWLLHAGDDMQRYDGRQTTVTRVVDGDTLIVNIADGEEPTTRIRLWGIDTPELAHPGQSAEPFGEKAKQRAVEWAKGKTVTLTLQSHRPRGKFGRVLAYVQLPDGSTLGERLLNAGLGRFEPRWFHERYQRYRVLEEQAATRNKGLWGEQP
jgi:endonuclease YncB( thermonuclease family)